MYCNMSMVIMHCHHIIISSGTILLVTIMFSLHVKPSWRFPLLLSSERVSSTTFSNQVNLAQSGLGCTELLELFSCLFYRCSVCMFQCVCLSPFMATCRMHNLLNLFNILSIYFGTAVCVCVCFNCICPSI